MSSFFVGSVVTLGSVLFGDVPVILVVLLALVVLEASAIIAVKKHVITVQFIYLAK